MAGELPHSFLILIGAGWLVNRQGRLWYVGLHSANPTDPYSTHPLLKPAADGASQPAGLMLHPEYGELIKQSADLHGLALHTGLITVTGDLRRIADHQGGQERPDGRWWPR